MMKLKLSICKIRDKYNKPGFVVGCRLSPEELFDDCITMTETLALVRALVKKPIQYIHISEKNKKLFPRSKKRIRRWN